MTKITLDSLNTQGVSVRTETFEEVAGQLVKTGGNRKAYPNSIRGRAELIEELPALYPPAIFIIWGDTPTVLEVGPDS